MNKALQAGVTAGVLGSLIGAEPAGTAPCCDLFFAAANQDQQLLSLTVLVQGMMKSKSGAT